MANKFMDRLRKMEGAVQTDYDPYLYCLSSPSPSLNWIFASKGHGLPFGFGAILYGPPKGGKSIVCNAMIGQLHKEDPEAMTITFNTELRGQVQSNDDQFRLWGIDPDRHITYDVNDPALIFDRITKDINAMCQEGAKIRAIVIDSLAGISGRREMESESVMKQQIGDEAMTQKVGMKAIMPIIRKYKIALLATTHVRAEMDQVEIMRGNKEKMAAAYAAKHTFEYFIQVFPNRSASGKQTITGEKFENETVRDFMDKSELTAHKIRVKMKESSLGVAGRTAEFTLDYKDGIINTHEEVFCLGENTGVITNPKQGTYAYGDKSWRGKDGILTAIKEDPSLYESILRDVYAKDFGKRE